MEFEQLEMMSCLQYVLESFTEARSTSEATEAANLAQLMSAEDRLNPLTSITNPWDYEILPGNMFADQVRVMEMPGTSQFNICPACNSEGTIHCFHCRGMGTDKCNFCRGTGMKAGVAHPAVYTHPMVATFPHADLSRGYASSSTAMARNGNQIYGLGTPMHFMSKTGVPPPGIGTHDLCYMCHGRGVKECYHCKGNGKKPCSSCCGSGKVRNYTRIKVYFKTEKSEFYTESEIPRKLLANVEGKEIFSEEKQYVLPLTKYPEKEICEQSKLFCAQHLQKCLGVCRVIMQRHSLVAIPVCKVHYALGKSKGIFFVYGTERQCYVPKYPAKCTIL
ncbi:hypothetical protein WR25_03256 [Diploscapter pachys]|uniref:Uncharacterized protein n=1 Tax=Diploscapter pachys TaxID=2018661 RepID=A0A2A2JQ63_9BILA|nr:hypothetical protein WR25_03256 [Diploscapter pachys]